MGLNGTTLPAPDIEPEADRAARHKQVITNTLQVVVDAMEEARRDGFYTECNFGLNPYGQYAVQHVALVKRF